LPEVLCITSNLIDLVLQSLILALDRDVQLLFLEGLLLKCLVSIGVDLVLFHHDIVIPLQKLYHSVFFDFIGVVKAELVRVTGRCVPLETLRPELV